VNVDLVYIVGTSFSGSTLLSSVLARHPQVVGLNELAKLGEELRQPQQGTPRHPLHQPFWCELQRSWDERFGARFGTFAELQVELTARDELGLSERRRRRIEDDNRRLFSLLAERCQGRLVVDASKSHRRLALLERIGLSPRVIHVVRSGRGVFRSALSRGGRMRDVVADLHLDALRGERLRRRRPPARFLRVRYEMLAADLQASLEPLCSFLGLEPSPEMVTLDQPVPNPCAVGAKGYWMLARGTRLEPPALAVLSRSDELRYRALGLGRRDALLGIEP